MNTKTQLSPEHKQYILKHEQDIRDNDWKKFFAYQHYPQGIGVPLVNAGVSFMNYLGYVPSLCFAFSECPSNITIPEGVEYVQSDAFAYCTGLMHISIPSTMDHFCGRSFYHIKNDLVITYNGTKQQWKDIYDYKDFEHTYFTVNCIDGKIVKKKK